MSTRRALGIDIGGSGIKAAVVDTGRGVLIGERRRVVTPASLLPDEVLTATAELASELPGRLPLGVGFPAVVADGVVRTPFTAHQVRAWLGCPVAERLSELTGRRVVVVNDADAAGIAEMRFGSGRGEKGVVMAFTLGTGIGSALFVDGILVPNLELGHLYLRGRRRVAEWRAAASARDREGLKWSEYAARLDEYLHHVERLFSPRLVILGGGVSTRGDKFIPRLTVDTRVVAASLHNHAGIIGAATLAATVAGGGKSTGRGRR